MQSDQNNNYWEPAEDEQSKINRQRGPIVTLRGSDTRSTEDGPIHWTAAEYIEHDRDALWFLGLAGVTIALLALAILLLKSWSFSLLIVVIAITILVYSLRPPRKLVYKLSEKGLYVHEHLYPYEDFKSFAVVRDIREYSIFLIPTKRFKPGVSVYFPEGLGEQIVDTLGRRLPMQERELDTIDKLVRKLRL